MVALVGMFGNDAFAVYDTNTGRFMQRDPVKYAGGGNLYGYVGGSPMVGLDPYGLFKLNFGPNVPGPERARIRAALNKACKAASDANKALDGVSECAAKKLGRSFENARRKLKSINNGCNSNQQLNLGSGDMERNTYAITYDPSSVPWIWSISIEFNTDVDGWPGIDGNDGSDDQPSGAPGNTWYDNPDGMSPEEIMMHELVHFAEEVDGRGVIDSGDRDGTDFLDDPGNLQDLTNSGGFSQSKLGKAVAEAEKCCKGKD